MTAGPGPGGRANADGDTRLSAGSLAPAGQAQAGYQLGHPLAIARIVDFPSGTAAGPGSA